jgi:transcriptional regulator of arginine metabolism
MIHQMRENESLIEALRTLLMGRKANTQEDICSILEKQGYEINQSKVSRLLRKIGATKVVDEAEQTVYSLPREPCPLPLKTPIRSLIRDIVANETIVIIFTSPGSASMIARALEYSPLSSEILGTIAGDDTIFIAPKSVKHIHALFEDIKKLLRE